MFITFQMKTMRSLFITAAIFILSLSTLTLSAQKRLNIRPGIIGGVSYYQGDMNHLRQFYSPEPAFGALLHLSFNEHYALRLTAQKMALSANDADFDNLYQKQRNHSFKTDFIEASVQAEFNFFPLSMFKRRIGTPYITTGFALLIAKPVTYSIPMGIGFKYAASKRLVIGAEWVFRAALSDDLDQLEAADFRLKQVTKKETNDWYSAASLIITYNFASEKKRCPAYRRRK
ncbi:MAG: hypothetical protein CSB06_00450 [Bacteroidia bacterium]|nr:MAG: hypothetical protein CSB06_00450 [Bacteroidia bacterium]